MNTSKLLAILLCFATCVVTTTAFAQDDDFGIESASPIVIADPVNPQPGMIYNAYSYNGYMNEAQMKESHTKLPEKPALKTGVDKSEKFGIEISNGVEAKSIKWEGFLKCKRAATYTFLFQKRENGLIKSGYSVKINGKTVIPADWGESSCDVTLKVGWNKIEIVCQFYDEAPLNITFRPKGSLAEPRPITPKDLFHDEKPEEDW
ncbi:MAG: hypothetical protein II943_11570 [Victivallales bacterium]|nr:hypothetical protein [Victivallales bacterium]